MRIRGEYCTPKVAVNKNLINMEENLICVGGFEELSSSEMLISGGISWKEIFELAKKAYTIAKKVNEYVPDFIEGFKDGWNRVSN